MVMLKGESSGDAGSNRPSIGSVEATDDPVRITQLPIKVERAPADSRKVQQQAVVWENLTERAVGESTKPSGKLIVIHRETQIQNVWYNQWAERLAGPGVLLA